MNFSEKYNDDLIIALIKDGHENAFEAVFKDHYNFLCNHLTHYIKDNDAIEQIVQQVFVNIWENRKSFSPKGNSTKIKM